MFHPEVTQGSLPLECISMTTDSYAVKTALPSQLLTSSLTALFIMKSNLYEDCEIRAFAIHVSHTSFEMNSHCPKRLQRALDSCLRGVLQEADDTRKPYTLN